MANRLWIDQHGYKFWAHTIKEAREHLGGGKVSKMFVGKQDGRTVQCGYVIGSHWCDVFTPMEKELLK